MTLMVWPLFTQGFTFSPISISSDCEKESNLQECGGMLQAYQASYLLILNTMENKYEQSL
jgi:hypothetical protein